MLKDQVRQVFDLLPQVPAEFRQTVEATTSPSLLADLAATYLDISPAEKQELLETIDLRSASTRCRGCWRTGSRC